LNWADWAIIAILGMSMAISLVRGFVREAMSLAVWVAAVVVALVFYGQAARLLADLIATPSLRYLVAWLALFFGVLLIGGVVNFLLARLVSASGLSGTDRLLGLIFGALRGFVVIMVLLLTLPRILPVEQDAWWRQSLLIPELLRFEERSRAIAQTVFEFFSGLF